MIKSAENLVKVMRMERNDPSIKTIFFGSAGVMHCHLVKHEAVLARGTGMNYERSFADAYANFTGTADKQRANKPVVESASTAESPEAEEADPAPAPKRRRGRPKKDTLPVTPHSDLEGDAQI